MPKSYHEEQSVSLYYANVSRTVATIGARASARFNVILHDGIEAAQTPRSEETATEFFNPLQ